MYEYNVIDKLVKKIKSKIKGLYFVGSYKRKEPQIGDLDIVTIKDKKGIINKFKELFPDIQIIKNGKKYVQLKLDNLNIDIWFGIDNVELKSMKVIRALDLGHNIGYRKIASKLGYKLNDYGLFKGQENLPFKSEKELRKLLLL